MIIEEVVSVWDISDRFEEEVVVANECKGASGRAASGAQRYLIYLYITAFDDNKSFAFAA